MKTTEFIPPSEKSTRMTMDPTYSNTNSMTLLLLQLTCMIAVFLITLAGALLPLKVIKKNKSISLSRRLRSERILSFSNCLAGGVFLATCFLGLLPSAREKFQEMFEARNITVKYPFCEATVIMGFFLILTFEQLALSMQQYWQGGRKDKPIPMIDLSLESVKEDGKLKIVVDRDDEEEEDLDLFNRDSDKQPMLSSSKHHSNTSNGGRFRVKSHHPDETGDAENGHHSHEAHSDGHSHLGNPNNTGLLRSLILLFALSTHSVFEGMALGLQEDIKSIVYLLIAMLAHESLAAFALGASLIKNSVNTYLFIIYGVFFSGMIPCGIALGLWIRASPGFGAIVCSAIMQALAAGIFIFVTFFEILNHELEVHRDRPQKIAFAVLGYAVLAALEAVG